MVIVTCDICGVEFEAPHMKIKICNDCQLSCYKSLQNEQKAKPKKTNSKLYEEVREAAKMGLSYGQYKGKGEYKL